MYGVLDKHLAKSKSGFLVGDHISIADIAHWGWVASAGWAGIDIEEFPHLKAWEEKLAAREGVEKGRHVPEKHTIKEVLKVSTWYPSAWCSCASRNCQRYLAHVVISVHDTSGVACRANTTAVVP